MNKIMVVDDDVDLAELVQTRLASEGHDVSITHSGEGAFELAKKFKPEIMLLDIMLPGITGYQICRKIRRDPELYSTPVLLLTAMGEEPEVLHGLEQGADDFLIKPFKFEKLLEKVAFLNNLRDVTARRNPVSGLPGTEAIKREVNHRLARGITIALCYSDMIGFKAYSISRGKEGQRNAIQFMAKMAVSLVRSMGIYESFVAHLGGGHFVTLLNLEDCERFCNTLARTFDQHIKQLYSPEESEQGYITIQDRRAGHSQQPLMALSLGVTHNKDRTFKTANKMFEVLAQVRQKAQPVNQSVVFVDRRQAER